ncbi:MAG: cobalt-zinc-cadmium efflux system outer membrane protein [Candidatus Azotimanducaceae bacterium]|jgi:cobalt-zinc-cadmium efflux system outer membrane protein
MLKTSLPMILGASLTLAFAGCRARPNQTLVRDRAAALFGPNRTENLLATADAGDAPSKPPSDEQLFERSDLGLYLRYGMHHNASLRSEYERWRAMLERVPQVTSLPDPVFSFGQFIESVETRTGPQERRYSLSQTFPWIGKLDLRGDVAAADARERWQRVVAVRLGVEREIQVAYFDYAYLSQSIRITNEVLQLLKQLEPVVQQRIVGANGGQQDLLRLQVEVGRIENDLASLQQVRASLSARLAAAMNLRRHAPLPLPDLIEPTLEALGTDTTELLRRAEQRNPDLRELTERISKNQNRKELAELSRWPDVTVGVDYIETGSALQPTRGNGDDPLAVRVMFNLPIWGQKYSAAEREAQHLVSAATHALSNRRATLRTDVEHAAFQLGDADRQLLLYRETLVPRAREALEVTRSSYRTGRSALLDLIDSERTLLNFETGYWRACRDHYQSKARLEALIGGQL